MRSARKYCIGPRDQQSRRNFTHAFPSFPFPSTTPTLFLLHITAMADKLRTLQNLEALQARHVGTGHADTTKYEWTSNILRDSYSSYVGHPPLLSYMAVGMGEPKEKVRAMMLEKMVRGAGNPPVVCVSVPDSRGRLNHW